MRLWARKCLCLMFMSLSMGSQAGEAYGESVVSNLERRAVSLASEFSKMDQDAVRKLQSELLNCLVGAALSDALEYERLKRLLDLVDHSINTFRMHQNGAYSDMNRDYDSLALEKLMISGLAFFTDERQRLVDEIASIQERVTNNYASKVDQLLLLKYQLSQRIYRQIEELEGRSDRSTLESNEYSVCQDSFPIAAHVEGAGSSFKGKIPNTVPPLNSHILYRMLVSYTQRVNLLSESYHRKQAGLQEITDFSYWSSLVNNLQETSN
jgi:hypothetical protein